MRTSRDWRRLVLRRLLPIAGISLAVTVVSVAAVAFTSFGALTAVWPTNALVLLAILRGPRERLWTVGVLVGAYAAMVAPIMAAGAPLAGAMIISLTNIVEIGAAVWLLGVFRLMNRDLTRPGALLGFLVCAALIGPAAGAGAAAQLVSDLGGGAPAEVWWDYFVADALGVMILAPFGVVLTREHLRRFSRPRDWLHAAGLILALTAGCFLLVRAEATQLALLTPLAVLATLRFGLPGAAGSVLWAGAVAIGLNLAGLGGLAAGDPNIRAELFQLQMGLAVLPLAVLPVAAVLAERDRAARGAQAADRAKSEFLANMSHEIRTPLNGVVAMAGLLARDAAGPREREIAGIVRDSAQTLERLLSDVLDLARIDAGALDLREEPFHLGETIRAAAGPAELMARARGLDFRLDLPVEAEALRRGDAARVRKILAALLSNAVKFTETGGIRLAVAVDGDTVRLAVHDTGIGFDPARDRVFDRFQQGDGSLTRRFEGVGLGLPLSRQLAEGMGGDLRAQSRPGHGSVFTVQLPLPPLAAADAAPGDAPSEAAPPDATPGVADRPLRVLLADDHPTNRKVVELILAQAEVELVQAENGAEAVDAFAGGGFDLVLMDMQMPVMDGLTAVRTIRAAEPKGTRTPILMLTANALPEHAEASFAAGADAHLTKPISAPALFAAIESALGDPADRIAA